MSQAINSLSVVYATPSSGSYELFIKTQISGPHDTFRNDSESFEMEAILHSNKISKLFLCLINVKPSHGIWK